MQQPSPALLLTNLVRRNGPDRIAQFLEMVTLYSRSPDEVARDLGFCKSHIENLEAILFDRLKIGTKIYRVLKPAVREQLNNFEEVRRAQFDKLLETECQLRETVNDPARMRLLSEQIEISGFPGFSAAFNELRTKMGSEMFKTFLAYLRGKKTPYEVAQRFKKYRVKYFQVALWRKIATSQIRALIPELAAIVSQPLTLKTSESKAIEPAAKIHKIAERQEAIAQ